MGTEYKTDDANDSINGTKELPVNVKQIDVTNFKYSNIISINRNIISFYFDNYGCQLRVKDISKYKVGQLIKVYFKGKVNKSNFKYWIEEL